MMKISSHKRLLRYNYNEVDFKVLKLIKLGGNTEVKLFRPIGME